EGTLSPAQGSAQFSQGEILHLADPLTGDAKDVADLLERFGLLTAKSQTQMDDHALPIVQDTEHFLDFFERILVAKSFKWTVRLLIAHDVSKLERLAVLDRLVERGRSQRRAPSRRDLGGGKPDFIRQFVIGWFAPELLHHPGGNAPNPPDFVNQMNGKPD